MSIKISEAFEMYRLEKIVYSNQSEKTEEMNRCAMKALIEFTGDIPIVDLTFDTIRKWKEHLSVSRSQNTVRGYIIKLRVVLKHLLLRGCTGIVNPELVGVPKRKTVVVDFVTPEEVNRLIDAVFDSYDYTNINRYRNRAIISLLYASGIRNDELCRLNRTSLQMGDNQFTVIGKGDKARLCFFDSRTKHFINTYLEMRTDRNPALFLSEFTSDRISHGTVQEIFRNAANKANFDRPIHPHTMRHSFATNLLKNNTNLVYVRDFLGHTSIQTTECYIHVVNQDLKKIYQEKHTI